MNHIMYNVIGLLLMIGIIASVYNASLMVYYIYDNIRSRKYIMLTYVCVLFTIGIFIIIFLFGSNNYKLFFNYLIGSIGFCIVMVFLVYVSIKHKSKDRVHAVCNKCGKPLHEIINSYKLNVVRIINLRSGKVNRLHFLESSDMSFSCNVCGKDIPYDYNRRFDRYTVQLSTRSSKTEFVISSDISSNLELRYEEKTRYDKSDDYK